MLNYHPQIVVNHELPRTGLYKHVYSELSLGTYDIDLSNEYIELTKEFYTMGYKPDVMKDMFPRILGESDDHWEHRLQGIFRVKMMKKQIHKPSS